MKIISRTALRMNCPPSIYLAHDDNTDSGVEVHLCPLCGDAEVWVSGVCHFKAYADEVDGGAVIGLSGFIKQPRDRAGWTELISRCDRLPTTEARIALHEYAVALGVEIEADILSRRKTLKPMKLAPKRTQRKSRAHSGS